MMACLTFGIVMNILLVIRAYDIYDGIKCIQNEINVCNEWRDAMVTNHMHSLDCYSGKCFPALVMYNSVNYHADFIMRNSVMNVNITKTTGNLRQYHVYNFLDYFIGMMFYDEDDITWSASDYFNAYDYVDVAEWGEIKNID